MRNLIYFIVLSISIVCNIKKGETQNKKHLEKKKSADNKLQYSTIRIKLKAGERFSFDYTDTLLTSLTLNFSNPGDQDTLIERTIPSSYPFSLSYNIVFQNKDGSYKPERFLFLAYPGDTLDFETLGVYYLRLIRGKPSSDLNRLSKLIKTNEKLPRKKFPQFTKADWDSYYSIIKTSYKKITVQNDSMYKTGLLDKESNLIFGYGNDMEYYQKLLSPVLNKEIDLKKIQNYIKKELPAIESLLQKIVYYSPPLINIAGGVYKFKTYEAGMDRNDWINVLNVFEEQNRGELTPGFQIFCLRNYPLKNTTVFKENMIAVKSKIESNKERAYIDSIYRDFTSRQSISSMVADTLADLTGAKFVWNKLIESYKEKYILVDFWASWCAPCRAQFPALERFKSESKDLPIEFISINLDEDRDDWVTASKAEQRYLEKNNFRIIYAKQSALVKKLRIESIPRILLVGKNSKTLSDNFYFPVDPSFKKNLLSIIKTE